MAVQRLRSCNGDIKHACPKCRTWAEQHAKDTSMRIRPEIQEA